MTTTATNDRLLDIVTTTLRTRSFATLATTSPAGRAHVAGILYAAVGTTLYVSTDRSSRKARNVAANPHVAATVLRRRSPVGPPSTVQFQGTGAVLDVDDPEVTALAASGALKTITGHGELERPDGCVLRITPNRRVHTYGLGMSLLQLIRHPLDAAGVVELPG